MLAWPYGPGGTALLAEGVGARPGRAWDEPEKPYKCITWRCLGQVCKGGIQPGGTGAMAVVVTLNRQGFYECGRHRSQ